MKGIISALTAAAVMLSSAVMTVYADKAPIYTDDSDVTITERYITGDINNDSKLNVSDMVMLNNYLHSREYKYIIASEYDLNYDDSIDVFDLIVLRKLILDPEKAYIGTKTVSVLESDAKKESRSAVAGSTDEVMAFLKDIGTDDDEITKYAEIYNDSFFENNKVVLSTFVQTYGSGVHIGLSAYELLDRKTVQMYMKLSEPENGIGTFCMYIFPMYETHRMLYPKTENVLLLQYVISNKVEVNEKYEPILIDPVAIVESDYSAYKYTSPDESKAIYITQETYAADYSETKAYYVNADDSYSFAADMPSSKGYAPFDDKGKWVKDETGNDVFTNGESYKLTWLDDRVIIEYISDYEKWVIQVIEFK